MQKKTISTEELRAKLGEHVRAVAAGRQITVITYHGLEVAALVAIRDVPENLLGDDQA